MRNQIFGKKNLILNMKKTCLLEMKYLILFTKEWLLDEAIYKNDLFQKTIKLLIITKVLKLNALIFDINSSNHEKKSGNLNLLFQRLKALTFVENFLY